MSWERGDSRGSGSSPNLFLHGEVCASQPGLPWLSSTGSRPARGLPEPEKSSTSPWCDAPPASRRPRCRSLRRRMQAGVAFTAWGGGLCCSAPTSQCPGIAVSGGWGQEFAPVAAGPPPRQQQNPQRCKNSLTPKEEGPHFLLMPPTDRLHSLQTYNNTKQKQQTQPPHTTQLQKDRCRGTGACCLQPWVAPGCAHPSPPCSEPRLRTRLSSSLLPSHPQKSDRLSPGHLNQPDSGWEGSRKPLAPPAKSGAPQRILWPSSA